MTLYMNNKSLPFLKWAGGKRWLSSRVTPVLSSELKKTKGEYFEPFLGAGAIFFSLSPGKATLSDINQNLIEVYKEVQKNWLALVDELKTWPITKDYYYKIRNKVPNTSFERACRFLYLNRTCYGGLYRENKLGEFNVPYGGGERNHFSLWEKNLLQDAAKVLSNDVKFEVCDFEKTMAKASEGDVVYCDPTYSTQGRKQFDRYGKSVFSWADQFRLAVAAERAMERGVLVLVSNAGCFELNKFYPRAYRLELERNKTIGNKAKAPSSNKESLYILDPKSRRSHWQKVGDVINKKGRISVNSTGGLSNNRLQKIVAE